MVSVLINDYLTNKRTNLYFMASDFQQANANWNNADTLLRDLQHLDIFYGRETWADLEPAHYRLMITKNLQAITEIPEEERLNPDNSVVASLNFLICSLIRCLEIRTDCQLEFLKINRIASMEAVFEYSAVLRMEVKPTRKPRSDKETGISVVVDNTKE